MGRRGAHRAYLRPAIESQPLARHGGELAVAAAPDVVTKPDGSAQEWTGIRVADELQHLWNVTCTEPVSRWRTRRATWSDNRWRVSGLRPFVGVDIPSR